MSGPMSLLFTLGIVRQWVLDGDPEAKPFLDNGAVQIVEINGIRDVAFHREKFIETLLGGGAA